MSTPFSLLANWQHQAITLDHTRASDEDTRGVSGADPLVFSKGGAMKEGGLPVEGFRRHPSPENFEISSLRKRDFCHSEAKSACFNTSLFNVKMPFFLYQNITKLRKNDANLHL